MRESDTGRLDTVTLGQITTQWSYTPFGEPHVLTTSLSTEDGPEVLYEETFTYDKRGWITDLIRTQSGATVTESFTYDNRGRLETVKHDGVPFASYGYDANSNRTSYDGTFGTVTSTVYDARDRLLQYGDKTYAYNDAGELESKSQNGQTVTYDYDVLGNLRQVVLPAGTTIGYVIDGAQRRIGKKVDGHLTRTWLYQDSLNPIAELNATGAVVSRFVYGTKPNVPDYTIKDGTTYRIIADHLGSPRLVVDASTGTIAQELRYDEFGQITLDTNPGFQPFGFAGGLYDDETGLVRFGARDYDPEIGRWTAIDPIGFGGRSLNLFSYASNSPISFLDLNGLATMLGIHTDAKPTNSFGRGHAWLSVLDTETGNVETYGLWPDNNPFWNDEESDLQKNWELDGNTAEQSRFYLLNFDEAQKLDEFLEPDREWTPTFNCASFASDAVHSVTGERLDVDDYLGIETPRELSETIEELRGKAP